MIDKEHCTRCDGTGQVMSIIEDVLYTCGRCGGVGGIPIHGEGPYWFFTSNNSRQRIASVQQENDEDPDSEWRLTFYDQAGPSNHWLESRNKVFGDLRGWKLSTTAPKLLDLWATKDKWKHGMKQMELVGLVNLFMSSRVNEAAMKDYNSVRERRLEIDPLIIELKQLKAVHAPDVEIW